MIPYGQQTDRGGTICPVCDEEFVASGKTEDEITKGSGKLYAIHYEKEHAHNANE